VPGAVVAAHELPQFAAAAHIEMGQDLDAADGLEVGMRIPVQLGREELLDLVSAVAARRAGGTKSAYP
jgi:hypothetical protein